MTSDRMLSAGRWILAAAIGVAILSLHASTATAQDALVTPAPPAGSEVVKTPDIGALVGGGPEVWTSPEGMTAAIQVMLLLTVLSLAPAILLMTTCFVRMLVVLSLLRQAIGLQSLPPSQVITSLALFMTLLVMTPTWTRVYNESIRPYTAQEINPLTGQPMKLCAAKPGEPDEAWELGIRPLREFMARQIEGAGNSDDVWLFYQYLPEASHAPQTYDDVPLTALLPAYLLSELKTAFLIGFQIYLPFLIVDIVVASVTISMGMLMLPPVLISLPLKLLLFVLVNGWHLVVGMLLASCMQFG
jgi:flagellar biosynthesis protein FliP